MMKICYTLLFALLLASCKRQVVVVEQRPYDGPTLSVSLQTLVVGSNDEERSVTEGETLHSGDRVFFKVRASQPAYLYVVLFGPDGSANVLFPQEGAADQSVPAGCPLRIPKAGSLFLQVPTGAEDVRVVASSEPLAKADRRLCEQLQLTCKKTDAGPAQARPCTNEGTRSIFSSVKIANASERGVASLRMGFKHDQ